jgi:hypothetical protein
MTDNLNIAIPLFVGYGVTTYPQEDGSRLTARFGNEVGLQLEAKVNLLLKEFDALRPDWNVHSLQSGTKWAVGELKRKHPELDSEALAALEWVFSWWWK